MSLDKLPKFRRPPVVETVLGVQFDPLPDVGSAHLGAFWKELGDDWPEAIDAPTLEPQRETFDPEDSWGRQALGLRFSQKSDVRIRTVSRDKERMIQLQNGRFHYNWLGDSKGDAPYPSYEVVREMFDAHLENFRTFLSKFSKHEFRPNQWEVTYVNHILKGTVWNIPSDWMALFQGIPMPATKPSRVALENFEGEWHYVMPEKRGRLHISVSRGYRQVPEKTESLVVTLTARGPVAESNGFTLGDGLDMGHEAIVTTFAELTATKAHDYWEQK